MNIIQTLLNFIYPPRCCVCAKLIGMFAENELCDECKNNLKFVGSEHDFSKTIRDKLKAMFILMAEELFLNIVMLKNRLKTLNISVKEILAVSMQN